MVVSRISFVEGPRENGHKVERKERLPPLKMGGNDRNVLL